MFETAELGRKISKSEYKDRVPVLRTQLLEAQRSLSTTDFPVIVLVAGVDAAGKSETVNRLIEWMDPRWIVTRAFGSPTEEERQRPEYWRFWLALPPRGRLGLFLSSWYSRPVLERVYRQIGQAEFQKRLDRIVEFEKTLVDDGALILKFWMHLGQAQQQKQLKKLEKDPLTRWRVTKREWKHWRIYDKFIEAAEQTLRRTSRGEAPWTIVEGADDAYRSLTVGTMIDEAIRTRLAEHGRRDRLAPPTGDRFSGFQADLAPAAGKATVLNRLNMSLRVPKSRASTEIERWQGRLNLLARRATARGVSTILVFEGWDASGKGGVIRRVTAALDAQSYQVIAIAAPTDEEQAHHYLWRFWRHLPRAGRITIFDRSWYGRVLVERVEGLATADEWMRAYAEINQFEEQLVEHGVVLAKFWLHITNDEQLNRFKMRESSPYKSWKLTPEDWRNREKSQAYELAVNDMIERTSTRMAPWTLVEANDKLFARVKVLRTIGDRLKTALPGS